MSGTVLVCGGAGYIGSHACKHLARAGYQPVVFDDLSTGHRWAVKWGPLEEGNLLDRMALSAVFERWHFDAVFHFAAKSLVAESNRDPFACHRNNIVGTINLIDAMHAANVAQLVFSSSAAVYGNPERSPIDEDQPCLPINPYGLSKRVAEQIIAGAAVTNGLRAVSLRYFNAAGADMDGELGEAHLPESHLIPSILSAALEPERSVELFGNDYETPDGTCIRDYVHVDDLCTAHLLALEYIKRHDGAHTFNLGNGAGFSVREVLVAAEKITGAGIPHTFAPRREGDPPQLVASAKKASKLLGWEPRYRRIETIIASAWSWHRQMRLGLQK